MTEDQGRVIAAAEAPAWQRYRELYRENRLAAIRPCDMAIHMKTTLNISDVTMLQIKREAARRRQTMSALVEAALRAIVEPEQREVDLPPS